MEFDHYSPMFSPTQIITQYQTLLTQLDQACQNVYQKIPEIPCQTECDQCCQQLFPMSLLEAYFLNQSFQKLSRSERRPLIFKARRLLKKIQSVDWTKLENFNLSKKDFEKNRQQLTQTLNQLHLNCAFLENQKCTVYPNRPHDCRVHGCSFDAKSNQVIGCPRFTPELLKLPHFYPNLLSFNHLYPEKLQLDRAFTVALTQNPDLNKTFYFTASPLAILKDFPNTSWTQFFNQKLNPIKLDPSQFNLIIDVAI